MVFHSGYIVGSSETDNMLGFNMVNDDSKTFPQSRHRCAILVTYTHLVYFN